MKTKQQTSCALKQDCIKTTRILLIAAGLFLSTSSFATIYEASYDGWFTLYDPSGNPVNNFSHASDPVMMGWRTPISGVVAWDDATQQGIDDVDPFMMLGGTMIVDRVHASAIGDGFGSPGPLILGNATATWAGPVTYAGIPISNVANVKGIFDALNGPPLNVGDTVVDGVLSASENTLFGNSTTGFFELPLGSIPMASTFYNTTPIDPPITLGQNPSGGLPIFTDTVPGTPMSTPPFTGYSGSFDMTNFTITTIIPVPASVWLFLSGIAGLTALARRRVRKA